MQRILPGLYTFTGLVIGRVYLIRDRDGLTLIDTGLALAADRIIRQITRAGGRADQVRRILITHAHPDHAGGLHRLKALTGAEVIAAALERPVLAGECPIPRPPPEAVSPWVRWMRPPDTTLPPVPVDRVVGE